MSSFFALRALLFAGELLAGSMLIMLLAWAATTQKAASARHLIWTGAFSAVLLLPVLAVAVSSPLRILLPAPQAFRLTQTLQDATVAVMPPSAATSGISLDPSTIVLALGTLWLIGVSALALRFAIGMLCLAALKRRSRLYAVPPDNLPKVAATRRECELRLSDSEHGPIAFGVFNPVILLPKDAVSWPRERVHAVSALGRSSLSRTYYPDCVYSAGSPQPRPYLLHSRHGSVRLGQSDRPARLQW